MASTMIMLPNDVSVCVRKFMQEWMRIKKWKNLFEYMMEIDVTLALFHLS